ncbi:MAG: gamma-glutamyltransferase [Firmicutes bacterium]|nr:gamma-glutamyltransferase [Bacillota bacterium]
MEFDALQYNYPSRRNVVFAKRGMVATSQTLAAQAGLEILQKGGNAIDAAIATAACLTVVEPTSNGIGGDAFALVWVKNKLFGLNASGPAPMEISAEELRKKGLREMPKYGFIPVTVPGIPAAWAALSKRFGRLPFKQVLEPAIRYAREGYPVSVNVAKLWKRAYETYKKLDGEEFKHWFETFCPNGRPVRAGEIWKSEAHAETLTSIAETNAESFYRGELAEKIDAFSRKYGGYIKGKEDLASFEPEWVEPISINYRGYDIWEIPPNGQGITALIALNILNRMEFDAKETVDTYHKQIEAIKLAFADAQKYIADPRYMKVSVEELLSPKYAEKRRKLIGEEALIPVAGEPTKSGTVYLAAADSEGNMISYIQSNYMGFGSGLVVPGTGIALHNRGNNFSLEEGHVNCIAPGKKPYHTIIPGFLTKGGKAIGPFGVMGGFMQPQGHVQVIVNTINFHLNPQDALDAPRWQWIKGKTVHVEPGFPNNIAQALARKGHDIVYETESINFGRGQIIWRTEDDVLVGGTEPRTDGQIAAW